MVERRGLSPLLLVSIGLLLPILWVVVEIKSVEGQGTGLGPVKALWIRFERGTSSFPYDSSNFKGIGGKSYTQVPTPTSGTGFTIGDTGPSKSTLIVGDKVFFRVNITITNSDQLCSNGLTNSEFVLNVTKQELSSTVGQARINLSSTGPFSLEPSLILAKTGYQGKRSSDPFYIVNGTSFDLRRNCYVTTSRVSSTLISTFNLSNLKIDTCPPGEKITTGSNCNSWSKTPFVLNPSNKIFLLGDSIGLKFAPGDPTFDPNRWSISPFRSGGSEVPSSSLRRIIDPPVDWAAYSGSFYNTVVRKPLAGSGFDPVDYCDGCSNININYKLTITDQHGNKANVSFTLPVDNNPPRASIQRAEQNGTTVFVRWEKVSDPDFKQYVLWWGLRSSSLPTNSTLIADSTKNSTLTNPIGLTPSQRDVTIVLEVQDKAGHRVFSWRNLTMDIVPPRIDSISLENFSLPPNPTSQVKGVLGPQSTVTVRSSDDQGVASVVFRVWIQSGGNTCYLAKSGGGTPCPTGFVSNPTKPSDVEFSSTSSNSTLGIYNLSVNTYSSQFSQLNQGTRYNLSIISRDRGQLSTWQNRTFVWDPNPPTIVTSGSNPTRITESLLPVSGNTNTVGAQQGALPSFGLPFFANVTDDDGGTNKPPKSLDTLRFSLFTKTGSSYKGALTVDGPLLEVFECKFPTCLTSRSSFSKNLSVLFSKTQLGTYYLKMEALDAAGNVKLWTTENNSATLKFVQLGPRVTFDLSRPPYYNKATGRIENFTIFAAYSNGTKDGVPCIRPSGSLPVCPVSSLEIQYLKANSTDYGTLPITFTSPTADRPEAPFGGNVYYWRYSAPGNVLQAPSDMKIEGGILRLHATAVVWSQTFHTYFSVPLSTTLSSTFIWIQPEKPWNVTYSKTSTPENTLVATPFKVVFQRLGVESAVGALRVFDLERGTYVRFSGNSALKPSESGGVTSISLSATPWTSGGTKRLNFTGTIFLYRGIYRLEIEVFSTGPSPIPYGKSSREVALETRPLHATFCTDGSAFAWDLANVSLPPRIRLSCEIYDDGSVKWAGRSFNLSFALYTGFPNVTEIRIANFTARSPTAQGPQSARLELLVERTAITGGQSPLLAPSEWSFTPYFYTVPDGKNETLFVFGRVTIPGGGHLSAYRLKINATTDTYDSNLRRTQILQESRVVTFDGIPPTSGLDSDFLNRTLLKTQELRGNTSDSGSGVRSVRIQVVNLTTNASWNPTNGAWLKDARIWIPVSVSGNSWSINRSNAGLTFNDRTLYRVLVEATDNMGNVQVPPRSFLLGLDVTVPVVSGLRFAGHNSLNDTFSPILLWHDPVGVVVNATVSDNALKEVFLVVQNDTDPRANTKPTSCRVPWVTCFLMTPDPLRTGNFTLRLSGKKLEAVGAHTAWVLARDFVGNTRETPDRFTLSFTVVDTKAPEVRTVYATPSVVPVGGIVTLKAIVFENWKLDPTLPVTGALRNGSGIVLRFNFTPSSDVSANGTGTWIWSNEGTGITLREGPYIVSAYAKDLAGLGCTAFMSSCTVGFTDNGFFQVSPQAPPSIVLESPKGEFVNSSPTLHFLVRHPKLTPTSFTVEVRNSTGGAFEPVVPTLEEERLGPNGTLSGYRLNVRLENLPDGRNLTVRVQARTSEGQSSTETFEFRIDGTPPSIDVHLEGERRVGNTTWVGPRSVLVFNAQDRGSLGVRILWRATTTGPFLVLNGTRLSAKDLPPQARFVEFTAQDLVGNEAPLSRLNLSVDLAGPRITSVRDGISPVILVVDDGVGIDNSTVLAHVRSSNESNFRPVPLTEGSSGTWSATLPVEPAQDFFYYFTALDLLGNEGDLYKSSPHRESPRLVNEPPTASFLSPREGANVTGSVRIVWSASDPEGLPVTVVLRWERVEGEEGGVLSSGVNLTSAIWDTGGLSPGPYTLKLEVSDGVHTITKALRVNVEAKGGVILVQTPPSSVPPGRPVPIEVRFENSSKPIGEVRLVLRSGGVVRSNVTLSSTPNGTYLATVTPPGPGVYEYYFVARYTDGTWSPPSPGGSFEVRSVSAQPPPSPSLPLPLQLLLLVGVGTVALAAYAAFVRWKP